MPSILPILLIVSIPMILLLLYFLIKMKKEPGTTAPVISPSDALAMVRDKDAVLIDVRSQAEHDWEQVPGDVLIPLDILVDEVKIRYSDNTRPLILYCRTGRRSAIGGEQLLRAGYVKVFDAGGIASWEGEKTGDRYRT